MVGRKAKGWLSSSLRATPQTPSLLAEYGCDFFCDFLNDDQPYMMRTEKGPLVCVPYSNDINDFNMFARGGMTLDQGLATLREQFDRPVLPVIDRGYVVENGMLTLTGTGAELMDNPEIKAAYFGV